MFRLSRALEIRLYDLVSAGNRDVAGSGLRLCIISVFIDSLGCRRKLRLLFATWPAPRASPRDALSQVVLLLNRDDNNI